MDEKIKQEFYCKKCKEAVVIESVEIYHNYKCPICDDIINTKNYVGLMLLNCPTVRKQSRKNR